MTKKSVRKHARSDFFSSHDAKDSTNVFDRRWSIQYGTQTPFEITIDDLDRMRIDYRDERGDRARRAAALGPNGSFTYYDASVERTVTVSRTR